MKSNLHVIKVRAAIYQAATKLEEDYPDDPPIAVSEYLMNSFIRARDREQARFWRDVWRYFMERDCAAVTETLADITP